MSLKIGSLFAGIGGFDLAFQNAGWECAWQVEWDKTCQNVLSRHWPHVKKYIDVQDVIGSEIEPVDIITFGSPCQDLSVAGKRAGLDGQRSSMFFEATRIIKEMRDATGNKYPRFALWENVPGALTSNKGEDFSAVLDEMADIGALAIEWHVLDAQWFGIPQRRRRLFLVACFDAPVASRCGQQILPVPEDSDGDLKTIRKQRKTASGGTVPGSSCVGESGLIDAIPFVKIIRSGARDSEGNLPPEAWAHEQVSPTLNSFDNAGESRSTVLILDGTRVNDVRVYDDGVVPTLKARMGTGGNNVPMIASPITFNAKQDPIHLVGTSLPVPLNKGELAVAIDVGGSHSIRRLTPIECERLMGFPDNHTKIGAEGKVVPDTSRYKMLGNSVAIPVVEWIALKLTEFMDYSDRIDEVV
jgi:DNA (cytosine-5)-methyltransferase 1